MQLAANDELHAMQLRLDNAGNVASVTPNPALTKRVDAAAGESSPAPPGSNGKPSTFAVRVPARPASEVSKPLVLLRYASAENYAPIPLKVWACTGLHDACVRMCTRARAMCSRPVATTAPVPAHHPSPQVVPRWAFADGIDRLELRVTAHPSLKAGLTAIKLTVTMPDDVSACRPEPAGQWDAASRTLTWKVGHSRSLADCSGVHADDAPRHTLTWKVGASLHALPTHSPCSLHAPHVPPLTRLVRVWHVCRWRRSRPPRPRPSAPISRRARPPRRDERASPST